MNGIVLIDKPDGWTSFDAVAKVRSCLQNQIREETGERRKVKVGHTGTLDPAATGLLVLLVGSYTKKAPELTKLDKTYEVELTLGKTSSTGDREGELTEVSKTVPSFEEIETAIQAYIGEQKQTPPAYSAVKVNGVRAYKLARAGKDVEIKPRTVHIYDIRDIKYEYPIATFTCDVSSGTYIRTLAEDIGADLGVGAYMSALNRTCVGEFDLVDAVSPESFKPSDVREAE